MVVLKGSVSQFSKLITICGIYEKALAFVLFTYFEVAVISLGMYGSMKFQHSA